jgi:glycerophosphoryl diester phosphodiesterase
MKLFLRTTALCITVLINFKSYGQVKEILKRLHNPNDKHVLVAAHRGDWRNAPENSLQAYKLAIEMGVDIIETDLAKTSDGIIVVMHDVTIDRSTNGKGKPSDYTFEQLRTFRLRDGLGVVTKHSIPTLEEVMTLAKGKVLVNLDKSYPYYNEAYEILKKSGTLDQAIFKAGAPYKEVRAKYPAILDSITFMPIVYINKPESKQVIDEYQKEIKPVAFELVFPKDTSGILASSGFIKDHGSRIWVNSLWPNLNGGHDDNMAVEEANTKDSWEWLLNHGATIIQTDRPKELISYLRKRSLHN